MLKNQLLPRTEKLNTLSKIELVKLILTNTPANLWDLACCQFHQNVFLADYSHDFCFEQMTLALFRG